MGNEPAVKERYDRTSVPGFVDFAVSVMPVGGAATVGVTGELDSHTSPRLGAALVGLAADGVREVTVDLSGIPFIDCTGLSVLVGGLKSIREQGGDMVVKSPTPATRRLFEITGLDDVLTIV